jgi:glycine cleavage system H lipoate-binding protein
MLNTNSGSALVSGAVETKNKFGVKTMAKIEQPVEGTFIAANKKGFTGDRLINEGQFRVNDQPVLAGEILKMEVNSNDAKELVSRNLVIPVDKGAKQAWKKFEDDEQVKEFQEVAKKRASKGSK